MAVVRNCPLTFQDLSSRAGHTCSGDTYHCVEDEFSRIVEVCAEPIWIEPGILSLPATISLRKKYAHVWFYTQLRVLRMCRLCEVAIHAFRVIQLLIFTFIL